MANSWGGISLPQPSSIYFFLSVGKVYDDNEALNEIPFPVCLIKFSVLFIHVPRYLFRLTLARPRPTPGLFFIHLIHRLRPNSVFISLKYEYAETKKYNNKHNCENAKKCKKKKKIYPKIRIAK